MRIFLALLLLPLQLHAGVLFEPYGGYSLGTLQSIQVSQPGNTVTSDISGSLMGLRLGLIGKTGGFFALDGSVVSGIEKTSGAEVGTWKMQQAFVLIGTQDIKSGGRFYFGYGADVRVNESVTATGTDTNYFGTAYKFGIGIGVKYHISLTLEGLWYFLNRFESAGSSDTIGARFTKFNASAWNLNLNLPFVL